MILRYVSFLLSAPPQVLHLSPAPWKLRRSWSLFPLTCTFRGWEYRESLAMVGICTTCLHVSKVIIILCIRYFILSSLFPSSDQTGRTTLWLSVLLPHIIKALKAAASENCCTSWKKPGNSEWSRAGNTRVVFDFYEWLIICFCDLFCFTISHYEEERWAYMSCISSFFCIFCLAVFKCIISVFVTYTKLCWLWLERTDVPAAGRRESKGADRSNKHSEDTSVLLHRTSVSSRQGALG